MTNRVEQHIFLETGEGIQLEGALFQGSEKAAVITHPHPLYGGDMENMVVREIAAAYQARGISTLRFNFRGTGRSGGTHDHGRGEQEDVREALRYMEKLGARMVDLAGYSFGAWVLAHTETEDLAEGGILMVSPPAAMMDFSKAGSCSSLKLAVTGSEDAIAPPGKVRQAVMQLNPEAGLRVIKGADHFFSNRLSELKNVITEFIDT